MLPGHLYAFDDDKNFVDVTPDWSFHCPACGSTKSEYLHTENSVTSTCVYCKREITVVFSKSMLNMFGESIVDSWERENK